jgi:hypothetical protein
VVGRAVLRGVRLVVAAGAVVMSGLREPGRPGRSPSAYSDWFFGLDRGQVSRWSRAGLDDALEDLLRLAELDQQDRGDTGPCRRNQYPELPRHALTAP